MLYLGTLNIDIRPLAFELVEPEFTFRDVSWTDLHPPEHFSFSRCRVAHAGAGSKAGSTTRTPRPSSGIFRIHR